MDPIKMSHITYCRIETDAGGLGCSDRAFVRAALRKIVRTDKDRNVRKLQHEWIRDGLRQLHRAQKLVIHYRL